MKRRDERRWILPAILLAAAVVLLGGIGLAYSDISRQAQQGPAVPAAVSVPIFQQQNDHVSQTSASPSSPNVQGVQGNVTISVGQRSYKTQTRQAKPDNTPQSIEKSTKGLGKRVWKIHALGSAARVGKISSRPPATPRA